MTTFKVATAVGLTALAAGSIGAAHAQSVEEFYKGKTVTMYIGYSSGGGYDQYARLLSVHMGRHIPGNPDIVPRNRPGAGSTIVVNELYNRYAQDGTAIATFSRGIPTEQIFKTPGVAYDAEKMHWLGSLNSEVSTCVSWHTTPVNTFEDLKTRGMVVGGTGPGADTDIFPIVLNNVLGTKLKLITGYPGGNDVSFAMERKEVEGRCGWSWSSVIGTRPDWLKDRKISVLVQLAVKKHPDLAGVPFVMDLAKTEKERQILKLIFAVQLWGRPYAVGPQVPADRVAALRKAFIDTGKDPAFVAEMTKRKWDLEVLDGETVQKAVQEMFTFPDDVVQAAKHARDFRGKIEISQAVIPIVAVSGKVTAVGEKGTSVTVEGEGKKQSGNISNQNTKVTIAGKEAKRGEVTVGMTCKLSVQGESAKELACE